MISNRRLFNSGNSHWQFAAHAVACAMVTLVVVYSSPLRAFPFPVLDARSAALGGVGVAAGTRASPFSNPALAASIEENTDWILLYPSSGELKTEGEEFQNNLTIPGAPQDGDIHRVFNSSSLAVIVPDDAIGGLAYYNDRFYHSAKIIGSSSSQLLRHRAVEVTENGFSLARTMQEPNLPLYGFKAGLNVKLVQYRAYGYDAAVISDPSIDLNRSKYSSPSSVINFDFGLARELGVWKLGLVVKDLYSFEQKYSNSGDTYKISPQTRMGFSYHSRKTFWEIDIDLTKNSEIATESETQYVAFGWEYRMIRPLAIRLGYNSNSVGDQLQTASAGIGLYIGMVRLDFATVKNDSEAGMFSQLSLSF